MVVLGGWVFLMSEVPLSKKQVQELSHSPLVDKLLDPPTSRIRNSALLGPYSRPVCRARCWSEGGGRDL